MVIARFSFLGFLGTQIIAFGFALVVWWVFLHQVPNRRGVLPSHDPVMWFCLALTPFFLVIAAAQAWQFLFRSRRAIWIEGGALHYFPHGLHLRPIPAIPLDRITGFAASYYVGRMWVRYNVIRVETSDHRWDDFLTWSLSERRDVVLARLNQVLAESRH